jgi:signal peptidase I
MSTAAKNDWLRALWAGLLSLLLPGLGQIYAGARRLGPVLYVIAIAIDSSSIILTRLVLPTPVAVVALTGMLLLFRVAVAVDAASRVRARTTVSPVVWYRSTWAAAIAMIAICVGLGSVDALHYSPGWRSFYVASGSNLPTLLTTDYVLVDMQHPGATPEYGDVLVFRHPKDPKVDYIKRVVGLPGDRVQLRDTVLYLNGKPVPRELQGAAAGEPKQYRETLPSGRSYVTLETPGGAGQNTREFTVPAGSLFVLGDNRGNSLDSRFDELGYVPIVNIIGVVYTIYWSGDLGRILSRVQ